MARNVVLLCLDSLRKDVFDERARRIREMAGVEFAQCRAASSWSPPSHATMFTGQLPSAHGIHAHDSDFGSIDRSETVLADLPVEESVGVSANIFASSKFGFDGLFDRFSDVSTGCRFPAGLDPNAFYLEQDGSGLRVYLAFLRAALAHDRPVKSLANGVLAQVNVTTRDLPVPKLLDDGAAVVNRELSSLTDDATEPFFAFANYTDVHVPLRPIRGFDDGLYDAPNSWSTDELDYWEVVESAAADGTYLSRARDLYGATVDYLDRTVSRFVDDLLDRTDRETTVVVTADHGENLGYPADEYLWGHKSSLSEALLHVPLVVINPPEGYAAVESGYVSHLEFPTLLAGLARGETPDVFADRIPAEIIGMSAGPDPPSDYEYWDRAQRAVYEGETKWVWDSLGTTREFDIDHDRPCWQAEVDGEATLPDWAQSLFGPDLAAYKERASGRSTDVDVDAATAQRLQDLGYM